MHATTRLVVLADDRTGAHETAGACADRGCDPVPVVHWSRMQRPNEHNHVVAQTVVVLDLASRHIERVAAAERVTASIASLTPSVDASISSLTPRVMEATTSASTASPTYRLAHKIDSTLRGNWASEVVASHMQTGVPMVVVPAFPMAGRTCIDGVVLDRGMPVHQGLTGVDARQPMRSSEPAMHLTTAGAMHVRAIATAPELRRWLRGQTSGIAVCDAQSAEDLDELGSIWAEHPSASFAGTAASIAAAAHALIGPRQSTASRPTLPLARPILLVCGSLHDAARRQLAVLVEYIRGTTAETDVDIVVSPLATSAISSASADRMAAALAEEAHIARKSRRYRSVVVLGGDTASAFLGDGTMVVHGTLAPGTAWGLSNGVVVITRPGGFGDDDALIDLIVAHDGRVTPNGPVQ